MPFPIDQKYIDSCESKLGLIFPDGFKDGMKELNGGEIETNEDYWILHPFFDTSDKNRIKRTSNHIIVETESSKDWANYPEGAVTIGKNECGDLLVLLAEGTKLKDVVYKWSHETGDLETLSPTTEILLNTRS